MLPDDIAATLFDMDGLLIDSEVLWHEAEVEIFGGLGVPYDEESGRTTKGIFVDEVVAYWYSRYPWAGPSIEEVVAMLVARVGELVESEGRLLPGAMRAIDLTSERGPIALASSTPLALIDRSLAHFDLTNRFASVHSAQFEPLRQTAPRRLSQAAASDSEWRRHAVWSWRTPRPACSRRKRRAA